VRTLLELLDACRGIQQLSDRLRTVHRGAHRDRAFRRRIRLIFLVYDQTIIRFANVNDLAFLEGQTYASPEVVRRKIEWKEFIVAETGGRVIGFLQLEYLWSLVPYVALIRVEPERRRMGIGTQLVAWAEDRAREDGRNALYSSSQADEPEPQAWHRRVGFEECGFIAGINEGVGEIFFRKLL
jgi:N-acetylglutamate synthase-like GNAT family acetyltransferase